MRIETLALGPVEIDDDKVMEFVGPLLGLAGVTRCALLDLNPDSPVKVLQVADAPGRSFLVADPKAFFPDYRVPLGEGDLEDLGLEDAAGATVLVLLSLRSAPPSATANLLGPLVVNTRDLKVKQVVLAGSGYRADQPLPIREST